MSVHFVASICGMLCTRRLADFNQTACTLLDISPGAWLDLHRGHTMRRGHASLLACHGCYQKTATLSGVVQAASLLSTVAHCLCAGRGDVAAGVVCESKSFGCGCQHALVYLVAPSHLCRNTTMSQRCVWLW